MSNQLSPFYIAAFLMTLLMSCDLSNEKDASTVDSPKELHAQVDTINVTYISWACACANWLPTTYLEDPNYNVTDNAADCIYIEARKEHLKVPEDLKTNNMTIQLVGSFYKEPGVSKDYVQQTSEKPEEASVFRYTDVGIVHY